jgi:molybdenum cofactor biosynthesis enzyme MoaA
MVYPLWNLRLEISNYCNLKCPFCMRQNGSPTYKLNATHLTLDLIKSWFPQNFLIFETSGKIFLSGAVAEPTLNPNCLEIVKYLSKECHITIDSNGSTKTEEWWYELGKTKVDCVFSPDSLKENNNFYRINSDTKKVISNMKSFISGGGKASWKYIPFKHNEDELEEQKKLSSSIGATFLIVQPNPFTANEKLLPSKHFSKSNVIVEDLTINRSPNSYCKILGESSNLIEISPDGIIYPCCFSAKNIFNVYSNFFVNGDTKPNLNTTLLPGVDKHAAFISNMVPMIEKQGGIKSISLYHNKIQDIMSSDLYKFALKQSWETGNTFCTKYCESRKYVFETS